MQRRSILRATGAAAAVLAMPTLRAQQWPYGPVRIIVGFPPGGGTDALARVVGQKLTVMWGQTVVVENKAGVAGVLAADYVALQPSDGSTLLMAHINSHALAPSLQPKMNYDVERDFVPIVMVGVTPNLLVCNATQPAKTVPEIVALCKSKPGQISFGSAGNGSAQHLALELFKQRAQVDALHVPYKGSAPVITDLIGGQINYAFETMTAATPHVKSGKLIAIAQTRAKRAKGHPTVPTMQEQGYAGFEATTWYGLVGPGKLPTVIAQKINRDVNTVLAMPDVQERMDTYGAEDGGGSPEKFAQFIRSEQLKWAKVIKEAGVKGSHERAGPPQAPYHCAQRGACLMHDATALTQALVGARRQHALVSAAEWAQTLQTPAEAYAVQDAVAGELAWFSFSPPGHWKSGGPSRDAVLTHAPLPPGGVRASGAAFDDWPMHSRAIEAEIALRLGHDVSPAQADELQHEDVGRLIDAMTVSIEVCDSRWREGAQAPALLRLADLQSHAALALGDWLPYARRNWPAQRCEVRIGAQPPVVRTGTHSLGDPAWVLPQWLRHATRHGATVQAGTVVTTGTWVGMLPAQEGNEVSVEFAGIGAASLQL